MRVTFGWGTLVLAASLGLTTAPGLAPYAAGSGSAPWRQTADAGPAGMLAALRRDLNIEASAALARFDREEALGRVEEVLRRELGPAFAGAWLTERQQLAVAVTDPGLAGHVRAHGAVPRIVARDHARLDAAKARLDAAPRPVPAVSSWYVDVRSNSVVVEADPAALPAAADFIATSGADTAMVRTRAATGRPVSLSDVRGGDGYYTGDLTSCSIGFSVVRIPTPAVGGFVTAGHCGATGTAMFGPAFEDLGVVRGSVFPGHDYAWTEVGAGWTPRPWVNTFAGGNLVVTSWREAPIGASVCRSGHQTYWRCGTIQARNVTTNNSEGTVTGLTRTSVCSASGDSGGPFLSGKQAQGVTSRGVLGCSTTGTTYFQPLVPILAAYGLRLVTPGNGGTPPAVLRMRCEYAGNNRFSCHLSYYHPDPVQIRWTLNGGAVSGWNNLVHVTGTCGSGARTAVGVTVSNASGTASAGASVPCIGDPP